MYVVGAFQHSLKLELAIAELEEIGIPSAAILALPLEKKGPARPTINSAYHADGISYSELSAALGMIGMLLGSIYGFVLAWGPILWGLIGLAGGFVLGYGISYAYHTPERRRRRAEPSGKTEVFVLVNCPDWQGDAVKQILWSGEAFGVSDYRQGNQGGGGGQDGPDGQKTADP